MVAYFWEHIDGNALFYKVNYIHLFSVSRSVIKNYLIIGLIKNASSIGHTINSIYCDLYLA